VGANMKYENTNQLLKERKKERKATKKMVTRPPTRVDIDDLAHNIII
jgi:hypothetical protein